jgi:glycosyltransferase involved in cell wall biosynthesis
MAARSIHWFSQTVGPGRGLEELLAASVDLTDEFEIHLRGHAGTYEAWLESAVPSALRSRVFLHAAVPDDELPQRIAEHDIGFAGELTSIRSRDLTATNKIFQYLQSGLAVVASDTAGQREVAAAAPDAVHLYRSGDRSDLQRSLRNWLESPDELAASKAAAREVAVAKFCWEKEKLRLLDAVAAAVD